MTTPPPLADDPRAAWVRARYTPDVADYLLAADGFRVTADPARPALTREWAGIFGELARAGLMRTSQTGRYWWIRCCPRCDNPGYDPAVTGPNPAGACGPDYCHYALSN